MYKPLIINMFGGPGVGKTTLMVATFAYLKIKKFNCEMSSEFAKELSWEERKIALSNSIYIFGEQQYRLYRLKDKVDIIVTDCPLLLSYCYNEIYKFSSNKYLGSAILEEFNNYDNLNFFINRVNKYRKEGRNEDYELALKIDNKLKNILNDNKIKYVNIDGDISSIDKIKEIINQEIKRRNLNANIM